MKRNLITLTYKQWNVTHASHHIPIGSEEREKLDYVMVIERKSKQKYFSINNKRKQSNIREIIANFERKQQLKKKEKTNQTNKLNAHCTQR